MHKAKSVVWIISGPCHNMCSGVEWLHKHHRGLNGLYFQANTRARDCQARTLRSLHQCEDCTQAGCYCHLWGLPASQHQPLHEGLKTISSLWRVKSVMTCPTQIHSSRTSAKVHKLYTIIHEITSCYLPLIPEWSEKLRWKMPSPAWPTDVGAKQSSAGGTILQETLSCVFFWVSA